jgi:nickel superoxide dismutase
MLKKTLIAITIIGSLLAVSSAGAHCQVPCGIYDDEARVALIEEHITTIEKSMHQIVALGAEEKPNYNQVVRWVDTKEQHAQEIQDIVAAYFLAQRIKAPTETSGPERDAYHHRLELLHGIIVTAMKAKQSTDLEQVEKLRQQVAKFRKAYFGKEKAHHH